MVGNVYNSKYPATFKTFSTFKFSLQEVQWTLAMEAEMRQHSWVCTICETEMALDTIEKLLHKKGKWILS